MPAFEFRFMAYTQLHVHLVTAVKFRRALILPDWRDEMLRYQTGIVQKKGHKLIAIYAMPDHLHLLIGKRPIEAESDLMRDLKSDTSEWINKRGFTEVLFSGSGKVRLQAGHSFRHSYSQHRESRPT